MIPDTWGRYLWYSIHFIALDYPEKPAHEDAAKYKSFFENLGDVIPCYKCSVNYKRHITEMPIDAHLASRDDLFAWTVSFHNIVNKELGKPVFTLEDAKKKYNDPAFHESCFKNISPKSKGETKEMQSHNPQWSLHIIMFICLFLIVGGIFWSRKAKKQ
jgi:hypothetical protein